MFLVGLTGGIGSGKSTVSTMLAERGAVVIDADAITRQVQAPGGAAYQPIVDRFGADILLPDGAIDRPKLAAVVFADKATLKELEAIVHPEVGKVVAERMAEQSGTDNVVILDVPLMVETGRIPPGGMIVVDCPVDVAVERLVEQRGFDEADARRRIEAQVSREDRLAKADFVVDNGGSRDDLAREVDRAWAWLQDLRQARAGEAE